MGAFRLILYGFVYDLDYSDLRDYNATLGKISGNLNQDSKANERIFLSFLFSFSSKTSKRCFRFHQMRLSYIPFCLLIIFHGFKV